LKIKNRSLWNHNLNRGVKNPDSPYFTSNQGNGRKTLGKASGGYAMAKRGEFLTPNQIGQCRSILVGVAIGNLIAEIVAARLVDDVVDVAEGGAK